MSESTTKRGRLSEVARRLVLPTGLASTEWPSIKRRSEAMGVRYDQWQADLIRGALGKREDGKYAATVGGIVWSIPRQVGKTFTVGSMLFALCAETPGLLILWTAHHSRTSAETFRSMQGMAARPRVAPYIEAVLKGAGTEAVVFRNGSRILFGARDQGFGLGFAAVDAIVFDEAQRLDDRTRQDMVPAANRAHNPAGALLFYIGTPPRPTDKGDGFASLRAKALSGKAEDMFYVELGAEPESDIDDRAQWAKANPSFPTHTNVESMLRMREHLGSDDAWRREALGIWDAVASRGVIPGPSWQSAEDLESFAVDRFALGVEVGPDLAWASVALAGQRTDEDWHIELDDDQHTRGRGVAWLARHLKDMADANPQVRTIVGDVGGPIKPLLTEKAGRYFLKASDAPGDEVEITPLKVAELGAACSVVLSGVVAGTIHHIGQPQLTSAALAAGKRALADTGMWVWSRKSAESDITPIQAATYALHGAQATTVRRPTSKRAGQGRRVVTA